MEIIFTHINKPEPSYQVLEPGKEDQWAAHIAELARKGAALASCGKMCHDCAFKHPQPPTQEYYDAVDGAVRVLLMGGTFHCHTDDHQDAGYPCAGMRYAKQYLDTQE